MSVESIEGENVFEGGWEFLGQPEEIFLELDKAQTCYQYPGVHSGLERMREEEALNCALMSNVQSLEQSESLSQICRNTTQLIDTYLEYDFEIEEVYLKLAEKMAPIDPIKAQLFADKIDCWEEDRVQAYIEISRHQNDHEAQKTLNDALRISSGISTLVYTELVKRGFLDAQSTFDMLLKEEADCWEGIDLLDMQLKLQLPGIHENLEKMRPKILNYYPKDLAYITKYVLLMLLGVEAQAQAPSALNTLQLLKENAEKICQQESAEYAPQTYIQEWVKILEEEASNPYLHPQLLIDLPPFLNRVSDFKREFPDSTFDFDIELYMLVETLAPCHLALAQEVLSEVSNPVLILEGTMACYLTQVKECQLTKEQALQKVHDQIHSLVTTELMEKAYVSLMLFKFTSELFGVDKALKYMKETKELTIACKNHEDYEKSELVWMFTSILESEVEYLSPNRKQTLGLLYQCIEEAKYADSDTLCAIIDAEFSLI